MAEKNKGGRPPKDKYGIDYMVRKITEYTNEKKSKGFPILKECCLLNDWNYDYVMELQRKHPKLSQSIKTLLNWKEVKLEQGGLSGKFNTGMVIFTLKQPAHGWSDNPKNDDTEETITNVSNVLVAIRKAAQKLKDE